MTTIPQYVQEHFLDVIDGSLALKDFERWIYQTQELENVFTRHDYIDLISLDYRQQQTIQVLDKLFKKYVPIEEIETQRVQRLLYTIMTRGKGLPQALQACYDLYCHGYAFLDNLGLGYGLDMIVPPSSYPANTWEELPPEEQEKFINSRASAMIQEAHKVQQWLNEKKIVITNIPNDRGLYRVQDHRSEQERIPTAYQRIMKEHA